MDDLLFCEKCGQTIDPVFDEWYEMEWYEMEKEIWCEECADTDMYKELKKRGA